MRAAGLRGRAGVSLRDGKILESQLLANVSPGYRRDFEYGANPG